VEKQTKIYPTQEEKHAIQDYCTKVSRETGKNYSMSQFYVDAGREKLEREKEEN
jgi:hypothetical protein